MRKFSASIIFQFLFVSALFCQTNTEATSLNQQAERQLNQNPVEAIRLAEEAKAKAEQKEDKHNIALATTIIGIANYKHDYYDKAKIFLTEAISLSQNANDSSTLACAYYWTGNLEVNKGDFAKALDHYQTAGAISVATKDKKNLARSLDGLGGIYQSLNEDSKADSLYRESLKTATQINFTEWIPSVLSSLGNLEYKHKNIDKAISYFTESAATSDAAGNTNNKAGCYHQLALIYYDKNDSKEAMKFVQQAMDLYQQTGAIAAFSRSRLLLSLILLSDKDYDLSIDLAKSSFEDGKQKNDLALQKDATEVLYYCYFYKGDKSKALDYHIQFYELTQKNQNEELAKKLTQMELRDKFEKEKEITRAIRAKERAEMNAQLEKQKLIKKASFIGIGLLGIIAALSIFAFVQKRNDNRLIAAEKKKSDDLLLNILPEEVANELKATGHSKSKNYDRATVLFADIKNFTGAAEKMSHEKLITELDFYFKNFDEIISKYKIEKIKTIGDAYLCVGGLPIADKDNANYVVSAGLEMQEFVVRVKEERVKKNETYFEIRVGIHSGPLVAGIVGLRKFAYDIWGDTVNVAARMEQHGEEGKINISGATFELVQDKFICTHRGKIEAKNKGQIDMYFVEGALS